MPLIVPGITPASKKAQSSSDAKGDAKATVQDHQSNPGPVIPEDKSAFETKVSRDELDARKTELNK